MRETADTADTQLFDSKRGKKMRETAGPADTQLFDSEK